MNQINVQPMQELNPQEVAEVSGGLLPALFLFDVAIWAYNGYKLGKM
jgi:hypothetical protein